MKTICWWREHIYVVRFSIVLLCVFITHRSFGQLNENPKLSPILSNEIKTTKITGRFLLEVTIRNDKTPSEIWKPVYQAQKVFEASTFSVYRLFATPEEIKSVLSAQPGIIFIEKREQDSYRRNAGR